MKKSLLLLLVCLPLAVFMTACGGEGNGEPDESALPAEPKIITHFVARDLIEEGTPLFFVDVRRVDEFETRHIEGTVNIPLDQTDDPPTIDLDAFPQDKDTQILIICRTENRSMIVAEMLVDAGYTRVYVVTGGVMAWFAFCDRV